MPLARRARQEPGGNRRVLAAAVALTAAATSAVLVGGWRGASAHQVTEPAGRALGPEPAAASSAARGGATAGGTSARPVAAPGAQARPSAKPSAAARPSTTPRHQVRSPKAPASERPAAATGAKKGVGSAWSPSTLRALNDVRASWYYTWGVSSGLKPGKARFVPMIWGSKQVTASDLATAKRSSRGGDLLGFNEPDRPDQAHLTPDARSGVRTVAAAPGHRSAARCSRGVVGRGRAGGWLDRFMTCARQRHLRVDFIPLHFYSSNYTSAATDLKRYIGATYARYHKPVWITEYALLDFGAGKPQASRGSRRRSSGRRPP